MGENALRRSAPQLFSKISPNTQRNVNGITNLWKSCVSSVIRQTGESQNECFKKTKHAKFSEKRTFLPPWYAHVRNIRFSGNWACFVFLKHPFRDSHFCLIADDIIPCKLMKMNAVVEVSQKFFKNFTKVIFQSISLPLLEMFVKYFQRKVNKNCAGLELLSWNDMFEKSATKMNFLKNNSSKI